MASYSQKHQEKLAKTAKKSTFLLLLLHLFIVYMPQHMCGSQRTTYGSFFMRPRQ